jgi:hypothetical protein
VRFLKRLASNIYAPGLMGDADAISLNHARLVSDDNADLRFVINPACSNARMGCRCGLPRIDIERKNPLSPQRSRRLLSRSKVSTSSLPRFVLLEASYYAAWINFAANGH